MFGTKPKRTQIDKPVHFIQPASSDEVNLLWDVFYFKFQDGTSVAERICRDKYGKALFRIVTQIMQKHGKRIEYVDTSSTQSNLSMEANSWDI